MMCDANTKIFFLSESLSEGELWETGVQVGWSRGSGTRNAGCYAHLWRTIESYKVQCTQR